MVPPTTARTAAAAPAILNSAAREGRRGPVRKGCSTYFQESVARIAATTIPRIFSSEEAWATIGVIPDSVMKARIGQCQR